MCKKYEKLHFLQCNGVLPDWNATTFYIFSEHPFDHYEVGYSMSDSSAAPLLQCLEQSIP